VQNCTRHYLGLCHSSEGSKIGIRADGKILADPPPSATTTGSWGCGTGTALLCRTVVGDYISTEGVSLCVGLWRPRQHQGRELGSRPTPVHQGPVERAAMANQETPMAPNTICLGIDTGVSNAIVTVIPTVSWGCRLSGAGHAD
jgi:hypothetical protein